MQEGGVGVSKMPAVVHAMERERDKLCLAFPFVTGRGVRVMT